MMRRGGMLEPGPQTDNICVIDDSARTLFILMPTKSLRIEWPTVAVILATTASWMLATWAAGQLGWWPMLLVAVICVTLQSSCQHEVLHGHPTRSRFVNEALVFPALGLFFPFRRFKTLHLKHHNDPNLTDPYEDPETNFMAKADWDRLPGWVQQLREINNTLAGRLLLGPAIGVPGFWLAEARLMAGGDRRVILAWLLHAAGVALALWWVMAVAGIGFWTYLFAVAYPGYSLLSLRTFLEHRAEEVVPYRTCIVEDPSGIFGLLFLNNNLHYVHHSVPTAAWYELPRKYLEAKQEYLALNGGYTFPNYWSLARRYMFRSKAPVAHPFLGGQQG
jgi:fatty acid desaturase